MSKSAIGNAAKFLAKDQFQLLCEKRALLAGDLLDETSADSRAPSSEEPSALGSGLIPSIPIARGIGIKPALELCTAPFLQGPCILDGGPMPNPSLGHTPASPGHFFREAGPLMKRYAPLALRFSSWPKTCDLLRGALTKY